MNEMKFARLNHRPAISEIIGSLLMIAITLVAGAAAFGFVNGDAGQASQAVGAHVADNVNFLKEKETIVYASISSSDVANIWVYNNGAVTLTLSSILVFPAFNPSSAISCTVSPTLDSIAISPNAQSPQLTLSGCSPAFASGRSYTIEVIGRFGSTYQLTVAF